RSYTLLRSALMRNTRPPLKGFHRFLALPRVAPFLLLLLLWFPKAALVVAQQDTQKISKQDRDEAQYMFNNISSDVKKHYYDPKYHGLDWNVVAHSAEEAIKSSTSLNHALSEIAAGLDKLDDSHTFFLPPSRPYTHDFGWRLAMFGNRCFVTQVRPGSDA